MTSPRGLPQCRVARRGECPERRLARHCNMVTQQRDHATHVNDAER